MIRTSARNRSQRHVGPEVRHQVKERVLQAEVVEPIVSRPKLPQLDRLASDPQPVASRDHYHTYRHRNITGYFREQLRVTAKLHQVIGLWGSPEFRVPDLVFALLV